MEKRYEITDERWALVEPLLPVQGRGGRWRSHRQVLNAILWVLFSGAPWRDLPERYGPFQTAHRRLGRWRRDGTWERVLGALRLEADRRGLLDWTQWNADATSVRGSRAAGGARKKGARRMSRKIMPWA